MTPKLAGRDHHRDDGEAVEPVGQVHRVAGADDDEGGEGHEEPAEIEDHVLEEGQRQRSRERRLPDPGDEDAGDQPAMRELDRQPQPGRRSPCASAW